MPTPIPAPSPVEPPMPKPVPQMPKSNGEMITIPKSAFEDLKSVLSGIMQSLEEIVSGEPLESPEMPEVVEEEVGEASVPPVESGKPSPKSASPQEDEEFLKSLMAEGNNRSR